MRSLHSPLPIFLAATFWKDLQIASGLGHSLFWLGPALIAVGVLLLWAVPPQRRRVGVSLLLLAVSGILLVASAALLTGGFSTADAIYHWTRFIGLLLLTVATINITAVLLFDVLLTAVRLRPPAIVSDLLIAVAYIAAAIALLSLIGVNLTGIVATSAVVTAVIGFSLQDTLGNVMGGMAVQLDRSIHVGDWIRVGESEGRVTQIRWRHTAIETRNWDTVLIPNSVLTKSVVTVLGRKSGRPIQHRQWVYFNVDFRHSPTEVIDVVESALRGESIANVAHDPAPNCVLMDFKESYGSYALRYWLTDLGPNDPTSSVVRGMVYAALKRAGIGLSIPAHSLFLTEEDGSRRDRKEGEETGRRVSALRGVELFAPLTDEERRQLAARLRMAPFVRGETIMRQGSRGDWLYILARGEAEVRVASDDGRSSRNVATLKSGDFFGEMGLMTGGERSATVVATADVSCYRLDKNDLEEILVRRAGIAGEMATILARRRAELDAVREGLNEEAMRQRMRSSQVDLLQRIRRFFTLEN
ncbi:MAG TPA: cyclic nucleotide-binding domain-containing protein [Tepidisphaeraceae bacterium]|jgi:small-conductance mechanosensitive channel/CRP-like cAMP-binding protein